MEELEPGNQKTNKISTDEIKLGIIATRVYF
jgi:hypothetical protein